MTRLALTYLEAAEACGYGLTTIRQAIDNGALVASWATRTKPVIRVAELDRWLESLPSERPGGAS